MELTYLYIVPWRLRAGPKSIDKCPVSVQCLVAIYNCVTQLLNSNENCNTEIWKLTVASRFQSSFNTFQEQYEQRLLNQLSSPRVVVLRETSRSKSFMAQKLEDASRFLEADIARYRELNMNYAKNPNPSSTADLLKLQELLLLDIRFLAGCDIRWDHPVPSQCSDSNATGAVAAAPAPGPATQPT